MTNTGTNQLNRTVRAKRLSADWRSAKGLVGVVVCAISVVGCSAGDHVLRDGSIARRTGAESTLQEEPIGGAGTNGVGTTAANPSRIPSEAVLRAEVLLDGALANLRAGQPRRSLEKLLEARRLDGWEESSRARGMVFWTGHSYEQVGEPNAAMAEFRRVIRDFDGTPLASRAAKRLKRLESKIPDDPSQPDGP